MKAFMVGQDMALLMEDNTWACSDAATRTAMNVETEALSKEYGPQHGEYRHWIFQSIKETFVGTDEVDDEPLPVVEEGVEETIY